MMNIWNKGVLALLLLFSSCSKSIGWYNVDKDATESDLLKAGYKAAPLNNPASGRLMDYYLEDAKRFCVVSRSKDEVIHHTVYIDVDKETSTLLKNIQADSTITLEENRFKCELSTNRKRKQRVLTISRIWD